MTAARAAARQMLDALPGLKEAALAELGPCPLCGKPLLPSGDISFYLVTIARAAWDGEALRQRAGLEMQLGSGTLARVMGPDADLAKIIDGPRRVAVHERCAADIDHLLRLLAEDK